MNALQTDHRQLLYTLCCAGVISRQAVKSIYGRLLPMTETERGKYLKEVLRNSVRTAEASKQMINADVLRKKARRVTRIGKDIKILLENMADVMYSKGGVGLAANQIGVLKRLVVIDIGDGLIKLINPVIEKSSGQQSGEEGCLSVPDVWGIVRRPAKVIVKAYNEKGKRLEIKAEGVLARVLCHETDHLDGILFIDKAEPGTLEKTVKTRSDTINKAAKPEAADKAR